MRRTIPAIAALLIAGPALADGTITDGSSSFEWGFGGPTDVTQASFNVGGVDHMTASDWMFTFAPLGPPTAPGGMTLMSENYAGAIGTHVYDISGVTATIVSQINETAAGQATVSQNVQLTNTTFSLLFGIGFHYADFAIGGTAGDDLGVIINPNSFNVGDGSGAYAEIDGVGNFGYENTLAMMGLGANLKTGTTSSLSNSSPLVLGDVANAFEWSPLVLLPGETTNLSVEYRVFASPVPGPGALALLGLAGLAGTRRRR